MLKLRGLYAAALLAFLPVVLTGCATIMGNETHNMPVVSTPSDATIRIVDEKGVEVFNGKTPTTITLKKSDGSYFGKKEYTVTISKSGFATQIIPVKANASGLYIGGNLLFGGFIGWFIVDPLNGKMYNINPEVAKEGDKSLTHNNTNAEGGITIMLLQDVPESMRGSLQPLN